MKKDEALLEWAIACYRVMAIPAEERERLAMRALEKARARLEADDSERRSRGHNWRKEHQSNQ